MKSISYRICRCQSISMVDVEMKERSRGRFAVRREENAQNGAREGGNVALLGLDRRCSAAARLHCQACMSPMCMHMRCMSLCMPSRTYTVHPLTLLHCSCREPVICVNSRERRNESRPKAADDTPIAVLMPADACIHTFIDISAHPRGILSSSDDQSSGSSSGYSSRSRSRSITTPCQSTRHHPHPPPLASRNTLHHLHPPSPLLPKHSIPHPTRTLTLPPPHLPPPPSPTRHHAIESYPNLPLPSLNSYSAQRSRLVVY